MLVKSLLDRKPRPVVALLGRIVRSPFRNYHVDGRVWYLPRIKAVSVFRSRGARSSFALTLCDPETDKKKRI
jgi:hypothetical protein